jgi:hypothetical protein
LKIEKQNPTSQRKKSTVTIHLHERRLISWGTSYGTLHWGKAIISRDNTFALGEAFL